MATSLVDSETILAIDLGSVNTRAILFDVVDGQYRFIASGSAPSTINAPFRDAGEGLHAALASLQEVTGRSLVNETSNLILPSQLDGSGIDRLVVTYTSGPEVKLVTAGLLPDVSLESAQRLANTVFSRVVESLNLSDHRRTEVQLDAIVRAQPDMIILSGGTERGASRSVFKMAEIILLVCRVLPADRRPQVFFCGNQALAKKMKEGLEKVTRVTVAPNVRPSIDVEDLGPAMDTFGEMLAGVRGQQIGGLQALASSASHVPLPGSHAFGRIIRFRSQAGGAAKGILGVDLGASSTTVAAARAGKLALETAPFGVGGGILRALEASSLEDFIRWLPMHIPEPMVRDYIYQKSYFPGTLPVTAEAMAIEGAMARQVMQMSMAQIYNHWPAAMRMAFEPILVTGTALAQALTPAQILLLLLDGIQPLGVTELVFDQDGLLPSLGAASDVNTLLPVHVLDSGAFQFLGTVICPVTHARYGTPVLRVRLQYAQGAETNLEVTQGQLVSLPVPPGTVATIHLQPLHNTEIDPYGKRGMHSYEILGGVCGVVVDARGRPLDLPKDASRRREMLKKWALALNG